MSVRPEDDVSEIAPLALRIDMWLTDEFFFPCGRETRGPHPRVGDDDRSPLASMRVALVGLAVFFDELEKTPVDIDIESAAPAANPLKNSSQLTD